MSRTSIVAEIVEGRKLVKELDIDNVYPYEWLFLINYALTHSGTNLADLDDRFRDSLIGAGALILAAIEQYDKNCK